MMEIFKVPDLSGATPDDIKKALHEALNDLGAYADEVGEVRGKAFATLSGIFLMA